MNTGRFCPSLREIHVPNVCALIDKLMLTDEYEPSTEDHGCFEVSDIRIRHDAFPDLGFQSESIKHNLDAPIRFKPTPSVVTTIR